MSARDQAVLKSVSAASSPAADEARDILERLGVPHSAFSTSGRPAVSPISGAVITHVRETSPAETKAAIGRAHEAGGDVMVTGSALYRTTGSLTPTVSALRAAAMKDATERT